MTDHVSTIRLATVADVEDLDALDHVAAAGDAARSAAIRAHVAGGFCWVHAVRDHLDAYAVLLPHHFLGRDFVDLLMVGSSVRRTGVATKLLRALLRMEGTDQVFTSTNRSNTPMRELLKNEGWEFSGELDGLDAGDPEMFFFTRRSQPDRRIQDTPARSA